MPKGSELTIEEWLEEIGATDICFVGGGEGPPDFLVRYAGELVAVEATRLQSSDGWREDRRCAFERQLGNLIAEVYGKRADTPRWHARCEYDPREPGPPGQHCKEWQEVVRQALESKGQRVRVHLVSRRKRKGRGVRLKLYAASKEGSFTGVEVDRGSIVAAELADRIPVVVSEKTGKVQSGPRARNYERWWLVLDDEILMVGMEVLQPAERSNIKTEVRRATGREQWSKIIIVSRFHGVSASTREPKKFFPLWEDPEHPALPDGSEEGAFPVSRP